MSRDEAKALLMGFAQALELGRDTVGVPSIKARHLAGPTRGFSVVEIPEGIAEALSVLLAEDGKGKAEPPPPPREGPSRNRFRGILE